MKADTIWISVVIMAVAGLSSEKEMTTENEQENVRVRIHPTYTALRSRYIAISNGFLDHLRMRQFHHPCLLQLCVSAELVTLSTT